MRPAITVFIVDDNEPVQHAISRLMKASSFNTVCMGSIEELLAQNLPVKDAIIIADVKTARKFEDTFPRKLHKKDMLLPVIYLTDFDTEWARNEARNAGAAGYFRKPVDDQALIDAITFAVNH